MQNSHAGLFMYIYFVYMRHHSKYLTIRHHSKYLTIKISRTGNWVMSRLFSVENLENSLLREYLYNK